MAGVESSGARGGWVHEAAFRGVPAGSTRILDVTDERRPVPGVYVRYHDPRTSPTGGCIVRRLLAVPLLLLVISACSPPPPAPAASGGQPSATTSSKTLVLVCAGELPSFSYNKLLST